MAARGSCATVGTSTIARVERRARHATLRQPAFTARQACRVNATSCPPDPCRIPMAHRLAFGASTPWNRIRSSLSCGISDARPSACAHGRPVCICWARLLNRVFEIAWRAARIAEANSRSSLPSCHPGGARDRADPCALGAVGLGAAACTGPRANAACSLIGGRHSSGDELSCRRAAVRVRQQLAGCVVRRRARKLTSDSAAAPAKVSLRRPQRRPGPGHKQPYSRVAESGRWTKPLTRWLCAGEWISWTSWGSES